MEIAAAEVVSTSAVVLGALRGKADEVTRVEVEKLLLTIEWAVLNEVAPGDDRAAASYDLSFGDQPMPLAGAGAPLVWEFAAMEFAAVLGLTSDAGKAYLGRALELRYRLPRLWERVLAGQLPVWRAGRSADQTMSLPPQGALHVDRHLAPVAHSCSWAQLERLVTEALVRFDPEAAEAQRLAAAEGRHFDVHTGQVSFEGTVRVDGELDLADALDLDAAISAGARDLAALGSSGSLDVRRSVAAGDLARRQLALDLTQDGFKVVPEEARHEPSRRARSARTSTTARAVVLHVHVSEAALTGVESVGRCGNTRSPISVEQIRAWCGHPDTNVIVKPVLDLADHIHVEAYEVPDRLKEHNSLVDVHCAFPWCARGAESCDHDHTRPHADGGSTCSGNVAPLCRRHHRAKTHSRWTYQALDRGSYLWTSPHHHHFLRDHHGTHPVGAGPADP
ncbi:MAG: HNH endonuclease signature motif containing protein [Nocardioides sp.]